MRNFVINYGSISLEEEGNLRYANAIKLNT